MAKQLFWIR